MVNNRREIRTEKLNLKMCDMKFVEGNLMFELKNGKRIECISLEKLVEDINRFTEDNDKKIRIVIG